MIQTNILYKFIFASIATMLIATSLQAPTAIAQSSLEQIDYFEMNAEVDASGMATIHEVIHYDFGTNERRGIYREVPTSYRVEDNSGYNLKFSLQSVYRNDAPEEFKVEYNRPLHTTVRIGDPEVYINGRHKYELTYRLEPVGILADAGQAIIRLDAPGTGWEVPVGSVQISLAGPEDHVSSTCYRGGLGSIEQACSLQNGAKILTYEAEDLLPRESITLEAAYNKNAFSNYAEIETLDDTSSKSIPSWVPAAGVGGMIALASTYSIKRLISNIRYRQRRKQETVYPRYEPPANLTPGDIGLLIDNRVDGAELSATLIQLATTGYMKIRLNKEKKFFGSAEYSFIKLRDSSGLPPYQNRLFGEIFGTSDEVSVQDLRANHSFLRAVQDLRSTHVNSLEGHGFYKPFGVIASDLDARMTDEGYHKWAELEGFKMFLNFTEKDRLNFSDAPEKKPEQFSKLLPYAIALGVEEEWVKQFKDLEVDTSSWYDAPGGFSRGYALGSISQLSNDLHGFSASAVSSGTAGAGGGFSGGGFSGGGGGSW